MKAYKTEKGNLSIVFDMEETNEISNLFHSDLLTLTTIPDPLKGLKKNSKAFITELKDHFGSSKILRKNTKVKELAHKYYISDIGSILKTLVKNGVCEVIRKDNQSNNINYFILNL
jgi:hypothetical protein